MAREYFTLHPRTFTRARIVNPATLSFEEFPPMTLPVFSPDALPEGDLHPRQVDSTRPDHVTMVMIVGGMSSREIRAESCGGIGGYSYEEDASGLNFFRGRLRA